MLKSSLLHLIYMLAVSIAFTSSTQAQSTNLSQKYLNDIGISADPSVLFSSDFENNLAGWSNVSWADPGLSSLSELMTVKNSAPEANGGSKYLESKVTKTQLKSNGGSYQNISAQIQHKLAQPSDIIFVRFYTRYVGLTEMPHHWIRVGAGNSAGGQANVVPKGDSSFWFDLDIDDSDNFNFYAYWYKMKSGRCEDGSATPGCAGDQGTTYYYGNTFKPANQSTFARDKWMCVEFMAKANSLGNNDGELALWKDNKLVGEYKTGTPIGHWRRDSFLTFGQWYNPGTFGSHPFEGFNFRSSTNVKFTYLSVDAYYQRNTTTNANAPEAQTIDYDDFVIANQRIGCKVTGSRPMPPQDPKLFYP
jgi:hypothetical protein